MYTKIRNTAIEVHNINNVRNGGTYININIYDL